MMRYHQRVSPDALTPLSNGRRSNSHSGEGKGLPRFRSPSKPHDQNSSHFDAAGDAPSSPTRSENNQRHQYETTPTRNLGNENNSPSRNGGDVLLQWGHRKRSRCSRTEIRLATDESMHLQSRQAALKVQRREVQPQQTPTSAPALALVDKPPTPPPVSCTTSSAAAPPSNGKRCTAVFTNRRSLEERRSAVNVNGCQRSNGGSRRFSSSRSVVGKRSPTPTQKLDRKAPSCGPARDHKWNGASLDQEESAAAAAAAAYETNHADTAHQQLQPQAASITHAHNNASNAISGEMVEWPRIFIALTRKEKEDDFMAMKGTKLPHRPKKRAKNVDKSLQFCFPGMWLSDLTRGRYEVREKKCGKKQKRRGLKGMMESMESDSEG